MSLVIDLKPGEKILIGETVITNDTQRTRIKIDGDSPILREKDVLKEEEADTPCKKIYFLIQSMYLARRPSLLHEEYFKAVQELQSAAPTTAVFFMQINEEILADRYYKAMKLGKDLINHEAELLHNANR